MIVIFDCLYSEHQTAYIIHVLLCHFLWFGHWTILCATQLLHYAVRWGHHKYANTQNDKYLTIHKDQVTITSTEVDI